MNKLIEFCDKYWRVALVFACLTIIVSLVSVAVSIPLLKEEVKELIPDLSGLNLSKFDSLIELVNELPIDKLRRVIGYLDYVEEIKGRIDKVNFIDRYLEYYLEQTDGWANYLTIVDDIETPYNISGHLIGVE